MAETKRPEGAGEWRRLAAFALPYWRRLLVAAALLAVATLLGLALPWVIRSLIDTVFVARELGRLDAIAGALLGLFVAQSALSVIQGYLIAEAGQRMVADLRLRVYEHIQLLPLRFFAERRTGEIVSRVSSDVTVVQEALTETPVQLLRQTITLVGGLALMLVMNWRLTLITLALIPPIVLIGSLFGRRLQRISRSVQDRVADTTVALEELLSGIRVVKSFAREDHERARFAERVGATYETAMRRARVRAGFGPSISLVGFAAVTFLLWYGGRQVIAGTLTPGELIAFLFYMMMVAGPMGDFANLYGRLREALGAGERLFEMLDAPVEPLGAAGTPLPVELGGAVRFVDVSFEYDHRTDVLPDAPARHAPYVEGRAPVLHDVSLDVAPGQTIALVGPSGAGKTTLVNLIPRFYEPTAGRIEFDGRDARSLDLRGLRAQIGVVPQETFLFGGTIRENIAYGRPGADRPAIVAAAEAANAHEFIDRFPEGYDTVVGEKGVRLSVGQRQRIAIARVLLKNPRVLILDEATSALDNESERLVQEALERLMVGRTTFVIAHRLSTVQRADRIVVLRHGRVVESGTHVELLTRGGLYQRLWQLQFLEEPATV